MWRMSSLKALVAISLLGTGSAWAEDASLEQTQPESALIVFDLDGKTTAIRLDEERKLSVLQASFPGYRTRPTGEAAGTWKPKYEIYFNFAEGRTIRVLVAANSRYWTVGRGDFELRGMYFNGLVHELIKASSPQK